MTDRSGTGVLLAVVVAVVASTMVVGVAGAQSTSISLTVDGEGVSPGEETRMQSNPRIGIEASADEAIQTVIFRVNGDTVETFEPGATTFSRTYVPSLEDGHNEFTVVVQTESDVQSQTIVLTKDDRAPFVQFTSPFQTDHYRDVIPESVQVQSSTVTLSGNLFDATGVSHITIKRRYRYSHANIEHVSAARWDVENPSESFSQEIFLGYGTNQITIRLEDPMGQSRTYSLEMVVVDDRRPNVDISLPERTRSSTIQLSGEASDNVQLEAVSVSVEGVLDSKNVFDGINLDPDETAVTIPLDDQVQLRPGENTVTVTATDLAGNSVSTSQTVVYEQTVVPVVDISEDGTRFESDGSLRVSGVVRDGEITGVSVESVSTESGDVVDLARVYTGPSVRNNVVISETLELASGETRIVIRYTDSNDEEHQSTFLVEPGEQVIHLESSGSTDGSQSSGETDATDGDQSDGESDETTDSEDGGDTAGADQTTQTEPEAGGGEGDSQQEVTETDGGLPGFTAVTAAAALAMLAVLAFVGRRRAG